MHRTPLSLRTHNISRCTQVTDDDGRRRFHGAFTGGFSAGYYNSVGSREGWQPAAFTSSRGERAPQRRPQRAEDFMDADDDPLLGRRLETSARFDTLPARAKQQETLPATDRPRNAFEARVLGAAAMSLLDDFVVPSNESVGAKLLNQMGWKEGHGIGPRIRRKRIEDKAVAGTAGGGDDAASSGQQRADHEADEADVVYVPPRSTIDVSAFPKPKLDKYGAGFDPYVNAPEFSRYKQHQASELAQKQQARQVVTFADAMKATSGSYETVTGFGLSALEENDDLDVYGTAPMSEFDTVIGGPSLRLTSGKEEVKLLESEARESRSRERRPPKFGSDGHPALPGFEYAYAKEKPPKAVALRLEVPADFDPHHRFDDHDAANADPVSQLYQKHHFVVREQGPAPMMTAKQRAALLGEPEELDTSASSDPSRSAGGSVFDLLDAKQKAKLFASAAQARALRDGKDGDRHSAAMPAPLKERQPLVQGVAGSQFRANITASIAKRFVSAGSSNQDQSSQVDPTTATGAKTSYRSESAWTPTSLLCKRFHVKCITGASSSSARDQAEEKRDLFDKELVPHIVEFAAERRGSQGTDAANRDIATNTSSGNASAAASSSSSSSRTSSRFAKRDETKDEDELPPLPIEPKPAASLLKAIFEPSDESDVEEDIDDDDDEATTDGSGDEDSSKQASRGANDGSEMDLVERNTVTGHTVDIGSGVSKRIVSSAIHGRDRGAPVASDVSSSSSDSEIDSNNESKERGRSSVTTDSQRYQQLQTFSTRQDGGVHRSSDEGRKRDKSVRSSKKKKHKKERKHRHRHEDGSSSDNSADESDDGSRKHRKKHKESKKSHKRKKASASRRSESPERSRSRKHHRQ